MNEPKADMTQAQAVERLVEAGATYHQAHTLVVCHVAMKVAREMLDALGATGKTEGER